MSNMEVRSSRGKDYDYRSATYVRSIPGPHGRNFLWQLSVSCLLLIHLLVSTFFN